MLHEKGMQTDPVLISPLFHTFTNIDSTLQHFNYNFYNQMIYNSPLTSTSSPDATESSMYVCPVMEDDFGQSQQTNINSFLSARKVESPKTSRNTIAKVKLDKIFM